MPQISKTVVDADLRTRVFAELDMEDNAFIKVNDRQYGILIDDMNGVERYVRIGVIVAEERKDMTARELMEKEVNEYRGKQEKKAERARAFAEKAAADKARRLAKKKEQEEKEKEKGE